MTEATERAFAKVNLFLHVVGRRADGYHLLDSLAVFVEVSDLLHAEAADGLSLSIDGPFAPSLADTAPADNLVLRAARALAAFAGVAPRARLTLTKALPVASGLGGGSADAAAALRVLARLWGIAPGRAALDLVAAGLGADVPVCLGSRPARMGGVGEILAPSPALPPCGLALLNPGVPVATADVFRHRTGGFSEPAALPDTWADAAGMAMGLAALRNDLEPAAVALCPLIGVALRALRRAPGCLLARMSGSGATCFGLFATPGQARAAADALERPGWWSWGGGLHHQPPPPLPQGEGES
ncbi:MAG: 4-(cytidine 5'-diphospho)-2-C-methyl-D-erythritol kinase [Acetobacteraceae bacterium]|nr:4-(cytidine 5'-diphospho)-2-C-methyl-D-erythritol kinase [Acetobacteraceae bacterium]